MPNPWVEMIFGTRWEREVTVMLQELRDLGGRIMAQIDDLRAVVNSIGEKVDAVDTALDGIRSGIAGVADEVRQLIDRLGQGAPDIAAEVDNLKGIAARLDAVGSEVGDAGDALRAIPPAP